MSSFILKTGTVVCFKKNGFSKFLKRNILTYVNLKLYYYYVNFYQPFIITLLGLFPNIKTDNRKHKAKQYSKIK